MTKDPVADFWGNIECALGESSYLFFKDMGFLYIFVIISDTPV